ncbi:hypothetical protein BGW80DRAFT_1426508, partial [Lactifluus volemus]
MGGGARYPYPKEVWSPADNTAIMFAGIIGVSYGVWTVSAEKEYRYNEPIRPIPSMRWTKQYRRPPSRQR